MATYVNDLRLKEIATGDESGTWGTSTNTNLELIGEALGYSTEGITTNADTHTTTVADGSTDPGRAMYIKYTGALDSDCTITIAPNTMSRVHFIENATTDSGSSGPYNIIISQGSGANVTIPNGFVKAVYLDGAGSGAAVTEAFTDLSVGGNLLIDGTTPKLTIGDGGAEDTAIVFDGNAQDFYIGLDDSADDLIIGLGSTVGTTPIISIDENKDVAIPDGGLTITTDDNTTQLTLKSTDADESSGPVLDMIRDSASPADSDVLGRIRFRGDNDAGEETTIVYLQTYLHDASDGTEDGGLDLFARQAGTLNRRITINSSGEICFNEDSADIDFRVEGNNDANAFFVNAGDDVVSYGGMGTNTRSPSGVVPKFQANSLTRMDSSISLCCNSNDALSSLLMFSKTRSAARTGATVCQADDAVGAITWNAADGTDIEHGIAAIDAVVQSGIGSNDVPGALRFYTNGGSTSATERMRIDKDGKVGIGTTSPSTAIDVTFADGSNVTAGNISDNSVNGFLLRNTTNSNGSGVMLKMAGNNGDNLTAIAHEQVASNSSMMLFYTEQAGTFSEKMRINEAGQVAIGTQSPSGLFMIEEDGSTRDILVINNTRSGSNSTAIQQFKREGTNTGFIANTSSATSYATSQSDRRAKKNFEDWTESVLSHFKDLKPTKFHFTQEDDSGEKNKGYIAQDLVSSFPEAYPLKDSGEDADRYFFNPSGMVVYLMKAIQEQQVLIETLEAKVKVLEEA